MTGQFVQVNTKSRYAANYPVGYLIQRTGCWDWMGAIDHGGYGRLRVDGATIYAHRFLYERTRGAIPNGLTLDHLCRNRRCVNPGHLEAVTTRVNVLRGDGVTAKNAGKTHCAKGHPLTGDNLVASQVRRGARLCRQCDNAYKRARYRARRLAA